MNKPERKLSNIEMAVLGFAFLRGPCTIYAIMKELSQSESTYYKSRAGTAYSVANRLLTFGLLQASGTDEDRLVSISGPGLDAIRKWISPMPAADAAHSADLIRLRFFFLGALNLSDRLAFIDSAIVELERMLPKCDALLDENERIGDYFGVLATSSVILETNSRIRWLRMVRKWVESPIPTSKGWAKVVREEIM